MPHIKDSCVGLVYFRLNDTFFDVNDLQEFYGYLPNGIPESWEWFFKSRST